MVYANITRIVSVAVIIIGLVVMIGWLNDDDALKRLNPDWVTMKFSTAVSFFSSGIIIFLLNESRNKNSEASRIIIFAPLIIVLFFMATLLVSTIAGTTTGVSSLFVKEDASDAMHSAIAGTPSVGTMANFLLIIGAGFTYLLAHPKHRKYLSISGGIILALAIIALIGYGIDSPPLYYEVDGASGAMALHTAIAFALLGISLVLLSRPEFIEREISKKRRSLKISTKLTFAFIISALFPIIIVGFISFDLAQSSLEKEHFIELDNNAALQIKRIEAFFFDREADIAVISTADLFKREIPVLNQFYNDPTDIQYIESDEKTDKRLKIVRESYGYDNIMLLNPEGEIIFVSKNERKSLFLGKSFLDIDPDTFIEGKKGIYLSEIIPDLGADGLPELFISNPILDGEQNLLGIVVFDIPIQRFLEDIMKDSYSGETAETLVVTLVNDQVVFLHPVRFGADVRSLDVMKMDEETAGPAKEVLFVGDGIGFRVDYRNEEILAAWKYIPSLDWGLVSKIDTAEAFAPIVQLQRDITVLAIVFMIGIGFFGVAASRTISDPLIRLKNLAVRISEGDLDAKVLVQSTDEIGQLSEMMNETAEKLKEVAKEKDEFASMVTHELKTPLVPIQGFCEILKDPDSGKLNEIQTEAVDEIYKNSHELLNLIQNMLNAQKIELHQLKFNLENIDVSEYLAGRYKNLENVMKEKHIEFVNSAESGLKIKCDVGKLNEVFANIILNAVDFVSEKGRIEMGAKSDDDKVLFYVKDNGEGIPKEKIGAMFHKFYQVDTSATRKHGGSGLGLAICKGYIEGMGGKIWLESEEGKGATFFFTVPKKENEN